MTEQATTSKRFDRLTLGASKASLLHAGFDVIPSIIGIVQKEYGKTESGGSKKKIASALIKSVLPDDMEGFYPLVEDVIDLVFAVVKNKELQKLLKKKCSCV